MPRPLYLFAAQLEAAYAQLAAEGVAGAAARLAWLRRRRPRRSRSAP